MYTFVPNKSSGQLLDISPKNFIFFFFLISECSYIEVLNVLILGSIFTGSVSVSAFAFLVGIPIAIKSSAIGLKNCAITAAIKKYKSIIKKKKKKHEEIVLLAKSKLNRIEVLLSKALIDFSQDEFILMC